MLNITVKEAFMYDSDIRKALDDIAELKQAVRGHLKIMRPILLDRAFIPFSYLGALFFACSFLGAQVLLSIFGSFTAVPVLLKAISGTILLLILIPFSVIKLRIIRRNLARQNNLLTFRALFGYRELRNLYLLIIYVLVLVLVVALYASFLTGNWWILLTAFALFAGFLEALFAFIFFVPEYLVTSAICTAFGFISLFWMRNNYFLWLAVFSGLLLGTYGLVIQFSGRKKALSGQDSTYE
jgi:hypothetical protein